MSDGFWKEGETSTAACSSCAKVVTTTFQVRDVPLDDGSGVAEGILVSVCDHCDHVVAIPAQSTPAVAAARARAQAALGGT